MVHRVHRDIICLPMLGITLRKRLRHHHPLATTRITLALYIHPDMALHPCPLGCHSSIIHDRLFPLKYIMIHSKCGLGPVRLSSQVLHFQVIRLLGNRRAYIRASYFLSSLIPVQDPK